MGKFHDALNQFGQALELPDEFKSAISSAYDDDFSGADAQLQTLNQSLIEKDSSIEQMRQDYDSKLSALKSANWDLLRAGPGAATNDSSNTNIQDDIEEDRSAITISDLFGTKKN